MVSETEGARNAREQAGKSRRLLRAREQDTERQDGSQRWSARRTERGMWHVEQDRDGA